jgi:hypothetical protein
VTANVPRRGRRRNEPVLTRNHRQEALSRAYVQAIAGRCGLSCSFRDFDYGIDLTLHEIRRRGRRYYESGFKLDVQAKSTATGGEEATHFLYDLSVANYEDLRDAEVGCPRILVLLVLPDDEARWTAQTEDGLLLRHGAYWLSLKGQALTGNRKTVRVQVPRSNLLSVESLRELMGKVRRREPL